jgi:hypothetical protein
VRNTQTTTILPHQYPQHNPSQSSKICHQMQQTITFVILTNSRCWQHPVKVQTRPLTTSLSHTRTTARANNQTNMHNIRDIKMLASCMQHTQTCAIAAAPLCCAYERHHAYSSKRSTAAIAHVNGHCQLHPPHGQPSTAGSQSIHLSGLAACVVHAQSWGVRIIPLVEWAAGTVI